MADASKLKALRRSSLGAPPSPEEARDDLAPEPAAPPAPTPAPMPSPAAMPPPEPVPIDRPRIDGRTLRRSGRTVQFATRVSHAFDDRLRQMAMQDGVLLVEILERALDLYEASRKKSAS